LVVASNGHLEDYLRFVIQRCNTNVFIQLTGRRIPEDISAHQRRISDCIRAVIEGKVIAYVREFCKRVYRSKASILFETISS